MIIIAKRPWIDIARNNKPWVCEICGATEESLEDNGSKYTSLHVHHKDMLASNDPNYHTNNDLDNLQVLCRPCHTGIHARVRMLSDANPVRNPESESRRRESIKKSLTPERLEAMKKVTSEYWSGRKRSDENRENLRLSKLGKRYYNNGVICRMFVPGEETEGFKLGVMYTKSKNK